MPGGRGAAMPPPMDDRALVRALKALGDPTRFRMMQQIARAGELSCGQVAELFDVSQPTISHHLAILIDAGVLLARQDGKHRYMSVDGPLLRRIAALVPARLATAGRRSARARA